MLFDENDQRGGNKQLVGDWIKKFPERRYLIASAGKLAVQNICKCGNEEDYDRQNITANTEPLVRNGSQEYNDEQRHHHYPAQSYIIRKVHRVLSSVCCKSRKFKKN